MPQSDESWPGRPNWPNWIDAHCHLADPRLDPFRDQLMERTLAQGITSLIQGGVDPDDWNRQLEIRKKYGCAILPVFGAYPIWVSQASEADLDAALGILEPLLSQAYALGEIGLDFRGKHDADGRKRQFHAFETQLTLASRRHLPVVLHVVHAHPEALRILKRSPAKDGGIVHSFTGDIQLASAYMEMGLDISVGSGIFRGSADKLRNAVSKIPLESLVIESDAPDQPPPGHKGPFNEPTSILLIAEKIAELRQSTRDQVLEQSSANLRRIFRLND